MLGFENYLAVESAGGPSWHPKESRITFTFNSPGTYQVYLVDVIRGRQSWPMRLSYEKDRCTAPRYLSDGSIVFMRDYGGDENFQIGCVKPDGDVVWLTSMPQCKHVIDFVTRSKVYFNANIRDRSKRGSYRLDAVSGGEPELIHEADRGVMHVNCASPDEGRIILQRVLGNDEQELLLKESGSVSSLTMGITGDRKVRWIAKRFIDVDTLLVGTDYESDLIRFGKLTLSGEFKPIPTVESNLSHETTEAFGAEGSSYTYFLSNEEGYSRLSRGLFRPDDGDEVIHINLPIKGTAVAGDERNFDSSSSVSPDGRFLAVTMASPMDPSNIWIIDSATSESWKATEVSLSGLRKDSFSDATLHRFRSFDELSIPFFRFMPRDSPPSKGWPCVLLIHGGPEGQSKPDFNPVIQFLVSAGFAVVAPNIRGSTGYGRKYMDLDNVDKRLDSIMDIKYLALLLRDPAYEIDADRLVVYGGSYGGFAVLSSMTEHPELWRAGVDLFGISNFVTFLQNTAPWRRTLREAEYGSLERDRQTLERISPINKVERIKAPLFIIQGDRDERVPLSESLQLYESLRLRGVPVMMIRFPDEGHGVVKLENRIKAYTEVLEWLKKVV
ncbi:MAG: prolyl oligopeptidase family serine peptidase [Candidatus Bathyarchaeota archaeon]|nr:prolyl oligopeptidase family serine peptidase [Candidatus Bathyarchaeota archaeon]